MLSRQTRQSISDLCKGSLPWPGTLYGLPGRGKTTAALILLDCVRDGLYTTGRDLVANEVGSGEVERNIYRRHWKAADLCVIDQFGMDARLGSEGVKPFTMQVYADFIDMREGKPLLIVTNHPPGVLRQLFDDQIMSRIGGGTIIEVSGPDHRLTRPTNPPAKG